MHRAGFVWRDGEHDDNMFHKDYTPSERLAIADAMVEQERKDAKERQRVGGAKGGKAAPGSKVGKSVDKLGRSPRTEDRVAARVGTSAPTLAKTRVVIQAAESEPEKYGPVKRELSSRSGRALSRTTRST